MIHNLSTILLNVLRGFERFVLLVPSINASPQIIRVIIEGTLG